MVFFLDQTKQTVFDSSCSYVSFYCCLLWSVCNYNDHYTFISNTYIQYKAVFLMTRFHAVE